MKRMFNADDPQLVLDLNATLELVGYRLHEQHDDEIDGFWWTLHRNRWSGVETGETRATREEALLNCAEHAVSDLAGLIKLELAHDQLRTLAQLVVSGWESRDLAERVRCLDEFLNQDKPAGDGNVPACPTNIIRNLWVANWSDRTYDIYPTREIAMSAVRRGITENGYEEPPASWDGESIEYAGERWVEVHEQPLRGW